MSNPSKPDYDEWKKRVLVNVDLHRVALFVIDIQRDFCSKDGALAKLGSDVSPSASIVARLAPFLPEARARVNLVAFFQLVYDLDEMSEAQRERLLSDGEPVVCSPAGSGIDLLLQPQPGDLTFVKHRYSAFSSSPLHTVLAERGITTIAVAGVDTHICVENTVRHGYDLGYRMLVLSDLVATRSSERARHDNSMALFDRYFAVTLDSQQFLQMWRNTTNVTCSS